ncbi:hypothetical protein H0H92_002920 [Tricholoma furcatifolium]|nr:hypothetical protein H0H92_002920 [Tricholoma furcatifolium]
MQPRHHATTPLHFHFSISRTRPQAPRPIHAHPRPSTPISTHLQPWKHLCIREYTKRERMVREREVQAQTQGADVAVAVAVADVEVEVGAAPDSPPPQIQIHSRSPTLPPTSPLTSPSLLPQLQPLVAPAQSPTLSRSLSPLVAVPTAHSPAPSLLPQPQPQSPAKKRKRNKRKPPKPLPELTDLLALGRGRYDALLLAIIGVLEAVKWEGNVARWVRGGGPDRHPNSRDAAANTGPDDLDPDPDPLASQWFSDPAVLRSWALAGARACASLG